MLALVVALTGSTMIYKWLNAQTKPEQLVQVEQVEAVPIAVAALELPWGTKITKDMLKTLPYLKTSLPPGYTSDSGVLEGRVVIVPLGVNEPILESKLAPTQITSGGVSAVLAKGKRAVAVKGDKVIGISGFIRPGNKVDVLVTLTDPRSNTDVTKTVLENVLVLATGTQVEQKKEGETAPVDVYTLEVTPDEGEKLALAATQGKLQFALRNIIDSETVMTKGATIARTLASFQHDEPQTVKLSKRPQSQLHTVEVIREGKVVKQKMKL
jgi:pilus assembly protein CpaB